MKGWRKQIERAATPQPLRKFGIQATPGEAHAFHVAEVATTTAQTTSCVCWIQVGMRVSAGGWYGVLVLNASP